MKSSRFLLTLSSSALLAGSALAQTTGPSTRSTPYLLPVIPGFETISLLTVDNTGGTPDDVVPRVGGGTFGLTGIPDGLGAFDNGDGTFTLVVSHELGNTSGVAREHGAAGAFVSRLIVNKNTLQVLSGEDLMKAVYRWNITAQASDPTPNPFAYNRFCSGDLPKVTAYYNPATGLGTQSRIYMHGEEGGATGWQLATVVTGPEAGRSYQLGKFNTLTNGSGGTATGGWENALACPFPQDKTIVVGNNDGGTGIMSNAVAVYVGTKQSTGTEVEKAGLMNGTLKFILVANNPVEITNATTRATSITNGTRFSLSATASTTFSRPEDGAWNPLNPRQYYFITTDRLDQVSDNQGTQIGQTRLWRLTFDDLANPDAGGVIDLLIDGRTVNGVKVNMLDNLCVNEQTGRLLMQEDVGGAAHNGKIWEYDPATDTLRMVLKHDPARFGDVVNGVVTPATAPFNNDEEGSGIIDITPIMSGSTLHRGVTNEAWYISSDQAHYTTGITTAQVEGGQLFIVHDTSASAGGIAFARSGFVRDRRTGGYAQQVTLTNNNATAFTGPVHFVVDALAANVTLANASGVTAGANGSPYLTVSASDLAPGASVSAVLQFNNPSNAVISYTVRVLNGNIGAPALGGGDDRKTADRKTR